MENGNSDLMAKVTEFLDSYIIAEKLEKEDSCSYYLNDKSSTLNFYRNKRSLPIRGIGEFEFSIHFDQEVEIFIYFNGNRQQSFDFSIKNLFNYHKEKIGMDYFRQIGRNYYFGFDNYESFIDFFAYYVDQLNVS